MKKTIFLAGVLCLGVWAQAQADAVPVSYCVNCAPTSNSAQLPLTATASQLVSSAQNAVIQLGFPVPLTQQQMNDQGRNATPYQINPNWVAAQAQQSLAASTFGSSFFNGYTGQVNMANLCSFWSANIPQYSSVFSSCAAGADQTAWTPTNMGAIFPTSIPTTTPDPTQVEESATVQI